MYRFLIVGNKRDKIDWFRLMEKLPPEKPKKVKKAKKQRIRNI